MPRLLLDSDDEPENRRSTTKKPFGQKRSVHAALGGGKGAPYIYLMNYHFFTFYFFPVYILLIFSYFDFAVADILLWRNKKLSAGILAVATLVWFLFDVVEYNLIELLSHISLLAMFFLLAWSWAAQLIDRLVNLMSCLQTYLIISSLRIPYCGKFYGCI